MEVSHGKEEKRQESGKEKEKKESSKKEREKEVVEEAREESGQEKVRPKEGETQRKGGQESRNAGSNGVGIGGYSPFDSGDCRLAITAVAPPDWPKIVTLPGSPPNAAAFRCTQRSAACWSMMP